MRFPFLNKKAFSFSNVWICALICRILASLTHSHWFHPDEWCQTFEPANLIAHRFAFHSQEIGLHLRNLTWPILLSAVLRLSHWIDPLSIDLRIFSVNLFCGLMDLFILWGWIQLLERFTSLAPNWKNWSLTLLLVPWFTLYESVNPRGEHLSEIALWTTLGCLANEYWILTGIGCVAIFAFRYPSGLLSAGICLALVIGAFRQKKFSYLLRVGGGIFLGLWIFGLADWAYYGRPWESFWMYLQYNLFTGTSAQVFGSQGVSVYTEIFFWNWGHHWQLIPIGIILFMMSFVGIYKGIKEIHPWAIAFSLYLIGHLMVPHKEGRFMVPIETLTRWAAFVGTTTCLRSFSFSPFAKKATKIFLVVTLLANSLIFLHALRADLWKWTGTYQEIGSHLKNNPKTCAILTMRDISSILIPLSNRQTVPQPALGSYLWDSNTHSLLKPKELVIRWSEYPPRCTLQNVLLIHTPRADLIWPSEGCDLLPSGILKILPKRAWGWAMDHHLIAGAWYKCPSTLLQNNSSQKVVKLVSKTFGRINTLPRLGISAKDLETLGYQTSPPPRDIIIPRLR